MAAYVKLLVDNNGNQIHPYTTIPAVSGLQSQLDNIVAGAGRTFNLTMNGTNLTISLRNSSNTVLSTDTVDLNIESVVSNASYDSSTHELTLTFGSGASAVTAVIDVADMVGGLVPVSRTINGKSLVENVELDSTDIPHDTVNDTTVGSEINALKSQLSDVEDNQIPELKSALPAVYIPLDFEIGINRYLSNGTISVNSNAKRASIVPCPVPSSGKITVYPNCKEVDVFLRTNGVWATAQGNISTRTVVDLSGGELFCIQALSDTNFAVDAVPCYAITSIPDEVDNIPEYFRETLAFEIGTNRYLNGTTLVTSSIASRASVAPFQPKMQKFKVSPIQDYTFSLFMSADGVSWSQPYDNVPVPTEVTCPANWYIALAFYIPGNDVIPAGATPCKLEYVDFLDDYSSTKNNINDIELVIGDVNEEGYWETGGIGSNGENYDDRSTSIRTWMYFHCATCNRVVNNSESSIYVALYNASKTFVSRTSYAAGSNITIPRNGGYFRVEITNVDGDLADYDLVTINGVKDVCSERAVYLSHKKSEIDVFEQQRATSESNKQCEFKALVVSDVHEQKGRFGDIVGLINAWGSSYFDALLNCGDTVRTALPDGLTWHDSILPLLDIPYINIVGNHDAWSALSVMGDKKDAYNAIIAPIASRGGIVQPTGASTNGLNYYYRDFTSVRVIALDCMFWTVDEATWLENVLTDALTNSKAVICMSHYGFSADYKTHIKSLWREIDRTISDVLPIVAAEKVADFINDGGTFIAWLVGHVHGDNLHVLNNSLNNQLVITFPSMATRATTIIKNPDPSSYNWNCATYLSVDTYYKTIRLCRIGADIDTWGVKHEGVSLNYETGELIAAW